MIMSDTKKYAFKVQDVNNPKPAKKMEEMSEGAKALLENLSRTTAVDVVVRVDQVVELIGEEKTNELLFFVKPMKRLIRPRISSRSSILPKKRSVTAEFAGFPLQELLDAINEAQKTQLKMDTRLSPVPDPELMKKLKKT